MQLENVLRKSHYLPWVHSLIIIQTSISDTLKLDYTFLLTHTAHIIHGWKWVKHSLTYQLSLSILLLFQDDGIVFLQHSFTYYAISHCDQAIMRRRILAWDRHSFLSNYHILSAFSFPSSHAFWISRDIIINIFIPINAFLTILRTV